MAKVGIKAVPPTLPGVIEGIGVKDTVAEEGVEETVIPGPAMTEDKVPADFQTSCPFV